MEGRQTRSVVALDRRGEGLAWIQLGLWFLLAAAVVGHMLTWQVLEAMELGGPREMESTLIINRAIGLADSVIQLVGVIALLVGAAMSGRLARDGAARILFGVAAAGLLIMVASQLLGLALTTEQGSFDPDSPLYVAMRGSWLAHAVARPLAIVALLLALRHNRAAGEPAGNGLLVAVGVVAVTHTAFVVAALVGDPVDLGIGGYGLLVELAMDAVVLGGALVAVRRSRPREPDATPALEHGAAAAGAGGERAAGGLDIFAGALIGRAVIALIAAMGVLLGASRHTDDATSMVSLVSLLGNLGCALVMAIGINRLRAAVEPGPARVAAAVAALLLLFCALIDAQFLLVMFRLLAGGVSHDGGNLLQLVGGIAESLVALVAWLALLRCLSTVRRSVGDGSGVRGTAALGFALVVVVLASALFNRRALAGDWPLGPAMWLPLVGAAATFMVATRLAALARGLGARMRSGAVAEPPLARAVARERDGDG
jgi:hypothetical protein